MWSRIKRSATAYALFSLGVRSASLLFISPLLIQKYGYDQSHAWLYLISIFQFVLVFENSITAYFTRSIAGRGLDSASIYSEVRNWYSALSIGLLAFSIIVLSISSIRINSIVYFALGVGIFFYVKAGCYRSLLDSALKNLETRRAELKFSIVQILGTLALVLAGAQFDLIVLFYYLCFGILFSLFRAHAVKQHLTHHHSLNQAMNKNRRNFELVGVFKDVFAAVIASGALLLLPILVTDALSAKDAALVLFCFMATRQMATVAQMSFYVNLPRYAKLKAQNDNAGLMKSVTTAVLIFIAGFFAMALTVYFANYIYSNYLLKRSLLPSGEYWFALCFGIFLERCFALSQQYFSINNRIYWHVTNPIAAMLMLGAFALTANRFGMYALPASLISSQLLMLVLVHLKYRYRLVAL